MSSKVDWGLLEEKAWAFRQVAHAPYSGFSVGAALWTDTGDIFGGCNVENCSFGLTICAERAAVFSAICSGHRNFKGIAIVADTVDAVTPCGACLQVMAEFTTTLAILIVGSNGLREWSQLGELLPNPFRRI